MNKPDWEFKLLKLDEDPRPYIVTVKLNIDGHNVSFYNEMSGRKIVIIWFVDGKWKGEYTSLKSEIGAKFGSPMFLKSSLKLVKLHRTLFKETLPSKKLIGYNFYWANAKKLIEHLKKTCKEIKLADD